MYFLVFSSPNTEYKQEVKEWGETRIMLILFNDLNDFEAMWFAIKKVVKVKVQSVPLVKRLGQCNGWKCTAPSS